MLWWTEKRHRNIVVGAIIVLGLFSLAFNFTPTSFAAPNSDNVAPANPTQSSNAQTTTANNSSDNQTTCAIEKLGWILCPVIETAGKVGDRAFSLLANNFLQTEPELVASFNGGAKPGTYVAWEFARNIANIMFIIAFLIIIMSQVTGRGITNYGIKKLLPKLVVAAIAVNVSYYICQFMVDLTNVLGFEVKNFLVQTANGVTNYFVMPPQTSIDNQTSNGFLGTVAVKVLAIGLIVWFILPILSSVILAVVVASLVIIAILLMRKAFIVLLVVIAPIAFVFYLLPNTERLFQKWLKMFWQLLLVFPIVALLFGGGQLASAIILVAGTGATSDTSYKDGGDKCIEPSRALMNAKGQITSFTEPQIGNCNKPALGAQRSAPFMLGLVAAGIAVAPLFAVYSVLKGALSAAGAIGGRITGAIDRASQPALSAIGKERAALRKARTERRTLAALNNPWGLTNIASGGYYRRKTLRDAARASTSQTLSNVQQQFGANKATQSSRYARQLAGGGVVGKGGSTPEEIAKALQRAHFTIDKAEAEVVNAQIAELERSGATSDNLRGLASGADKVVINGKEIENNDTLKKAAIQKLTQNQDINGLELAVKAAGANENMRRYIAKTIDQNYASIKQKGAHLVDKGLLDDLRSGNTPISDARLDDAMNNAMGSMDAGLMASQAVDSLNRVKRNIGNSTTNARDAHDAATNLINSQLWAGVSPEKQNIIGTF